MDDRSRRRPRNLAQLFWPNVQFGREDECWPWRGHCNDYGYGTITTPVDGKNQIIRAHRVAFVLWRGIDLEDIDGFLVRHTCDNPPCCNPRHLLLGSHQDNSDDKVSRGRIPTKESHWRAVLTTDKAREIRRLAAVAGLNYQEIASVFGCSPGTVSDVVRGRTWRE